MFFTSYEFLLFLVVLFISYYLIPKKGQWILLLVFSYFFYAMADARYLLYIFATTLTTYLTGGVLGRVRIKQEEFLKGNPGIAREEKKAFKASQKKKMFRILLLCLLLNFGILAVVKYTNFTIVNVNSLLQLFQSNKTLTMVDLLVPLGISFYTFQSMGYIIDVYRGKYEPEKNLGKFALFVSFFPQLIQGPISRFDDLAKTLFQPHSLDWQLVSRGLQRMLWGYFKKLVLADRLLVAVNTLIQDPEQYSGVYVFVGMLFYAFELYCDFTGGIDITIGIAQVLGISVKGNFVRPYFSKNIKEYWRRWHISMGTWFTDYIFYPISVCKPMLTFSKFSRRVFGENIGKRVPVYTATIIVWFTTGIWHGSSWNFIVWGLMNCLVIIVSQELEPLYQVFHRHVAARDKLWYKVFCVVRTILLMSSIRMFDCYRDVPLTFRMFGSMFTLANWKEVLSGGLLELGLSLWDYGILAAGLVLVFGTSMQQRKGSVREWLSRKPYPIRVMAWYLLFISVILFGHYGLGYDASQFIYNQF